MALGGLTKTKHAVNITTIKGAKAFLVLRLSGRDHLSALFEYKVEVIRELTMLGTKSKDTELEDLLGTSATVTVDVDDKKRHFGGAIASMTRGQRTGRYDTFTMTLRPWLWFATLNRNSRVFQNKSVKDIVTEVLNDYNPTDVAWRLKMAGDYKPLDYCVQYDESDFDFISRLLEEYGIYYFFEHEETKHTLVLIDAMSKHKAKPNSDKVGWRTDLNNDSSIMDWSTQQNLHAIKAVVGDHDYLAATTAITAQKQATKPPAKKLGTLEVFGFPTEVVQNSAGPKAKPATAAATQAAKVLFERLQSELVVHSGTTNTADIAVGATFKMEDGTGGKLGALLGFGGDTLREGEFLVIGASYGIEYSSHEGVEDANLKRRRYNGFEAHIKAIPVDGPAWRPPRITSRPVARGPETAVVVGASGNEIETDEHGRIKVQFRWDRLGKNDKESSCWIRVAQGWAGKGFGMWTLPRVGQEVVVSFLGGNPDRPLVTGSVYNSDQLPIWELPSQATVSGMKTRSSKGGDAKTAHELRFDDAKGKEYIWLQSEKDFYRNIKANAFDNILGEERRKVKLSRREVIVENWYMDVRKDVMHNFGKDVHVKVKGDVFLTGGATWQVTLTKGASVKTGADIDIDGGGKMQIKLADAFLLKATGDMVADVAALKIKASGDIVLDGGSITLKGGGSTVTIGPAGVEIVGTLVKVNSGASGAKPGPTGSAAPEKPAEAKVHPDTEAPKDKDYDKLLEDPLPEKQGGNGKA